MAKNKIGLRAGEGVEDTTKKFLDLEGLSKYDAALKAAVDKKDADTLAASKAYADSLGSNYDPAGSAETAKQEAEEMARAYADSVKTELDGRILETHTTANDAHSFAISAQSAADKAQGEVDALETKVGEIPADAGVATVVDYVNKKTEGIASDAQLKELQGRMATAEGDIDAIQADYLKAADKTELQGNIDAVNAKADALIGTDAGKSARTIANEELAKQLIAEGASESLDTLQEIAAWIQQHPNDASAMNAAIDQLKALIGTIPEGVTATNIVGYIAEVRKAVEGLITAETSRAEGAEAGLKSSIDALKTQVGDTSVAEQVAAAKQQAIDSANATSKAYTDAEIAKTNESVSGLSARVDTADSKIAALEGVSHSHSNKAVLDGITTEKVAAWDSAKEQANAYTDAEISKFVPISTQEIDELFKLA